MLLMPNKKKIASVIVAKIGKPKDDYVQKMGDENGTGEYEVPEEEENDKIGLEAAMDDFLRAVEKKDAKAMASAFESAMVLCEESESGEG